MRAADIIVKCLEAHGIARVYCVPGESYLALLDAQRAAVARLQPALPVRRAAVVQARDDQQAR